MAVREVMQKMFDRNDNPISVGSRVVILTGGVNVGEVGTIRAVSNGERGMRIRVTDGPEGDPHWSSWRKPKDVALVE